MKNDFTDKGYNDKPVLCINRWCKGKIHPTWNANIGKCDACGEKFAWGYVHTVRRGKLKSRVRGH